MDAAPPRTDAPPSTGRASAPISRCCTREVHGKPLVYLDSANTGQKPASVIDAVDDFYRRHNANVSRAVHTLGTEATDAYEGARAQAGRVLQRARATNWCCAAAPLSRSTWSRIRGRCRACKPGDAIVLTRMEHHANIVPWQLVAERTGATIKVAELNAGRRARPRRAVCS